MTFPRNIPQMLLQRKMPIITIDQERCEIPCVCKKCLEICPTAVFGVGRVMEKEKRLEEMDPRIPGNYLLSFVRKDKCTACNKCIEVCPVGALKIEMPDGTIVEAAPEVKARQDYFKDLKEAPYPLFVASRPYSFDLNEDMIKLIRDEFNAEIVASKLAEAIEGKAKGEIEKVASALFVELGESWMSRTIQLGEEYSDRTIEVILESIDGDGNQFLAWPHVPQRFIEIAYLSTQELMSIPVTYNNADALEYRIPKCALFNKIKEKCGDDVANLMTCKDYCLAALDTVFRQLDMDTNTDVSMTKSTAKDGYCVFFTKKM